MPALCKEKPANRKIKDTKILQHSFKDCFSICSFLIFLSISITVYAQEGNSGCVKDSFEIDAGLYAGVIEYGMGNALVNLLQKSG